MIDKNIKDWIDSASYQELLGRWRMAPVGDPSFQGDTGDYYAEVMKKRRAEVGNAAHVSVSKAIG